MLNKISRPWLVGGWTAIVAVAVAVSVAMGANISTTALLLALGLTPLIVAVFVKGGPPSQSVSQILYSVENKASRR